MSATPLAVLAHLEWTRPWGLAALALPILVLLCARLLPRAPRVASGAVDLWQGTASTDARVNARHRPRIPLATWLLCIGLAFGALALAGPRSDVEHRRWRVVVDRSPSMYLASGSETRFARALTLANVWIAAHTAAAEEIDWCEAFGSRVECVTSRSAPEAWRVAPRIPRSEVSWPLFDEIGTLWITDRAPREGVQHAGVIASGGALVRGAVSAGSESVFEWDGTDRLVEMPARDARGLVCVLGARALPPPLHGVLEVWAQARGLTLVVNDAPNARLSIRTNDEAPMRRVRAGRDGWSATGESARPPPAFDVDGDLEAWLVDENIRGEARAIVRAGPGRIVSAWSSMEDPVGDPAAFVVSWASLFDNVLLPPPEVVSASERMDAGGEVVRDAEAAAPNGGSSRPWDAWLALAACVCVLAAWLARGRDARRVS